MSNGVFNLSECLCCSSGDLEIVVDFGDQPLVNNLLISKSQFYNTFPLGLNYCKNCTHLQLSHFVNPDLIFKNYVYVSGTSSTLKDYFSWFANRVTFSSNSALNILDIACNDGSQLDVFKSLGHNTYGIDPAENLFPLSSQNHKIVCDYLNYEAISSFGISFDIIVAQNVFAHVYNPQDFLSLCSKFLTKNGCIYVQTSQAKMLEKGQFDTIYHEHISFFSQKSMNKLVSRIGSLKIDEYFSNPIHGESHVFKIINIKNDSPLFVPEEVSYLYVEDFRNSIYLSKKFILDKLSYYKNKKIVVYGAAAKSIIYLNVFGIFIDEIVDDNPLKQGLFVPGVKSKVVPLEYFESYESTIVWLILAWNFSEEITTRIKKMRPEIDDVILVPNYAS